MIGRSYSGKQIFWVFTLSLNQEVSPLGFSIPGANHHELWLIWHDFCFLCWFTILYLRNLASVLTCAAPSAAMAPQYCVWWFCGVRHSCRRVWQSPCRDPGLPDGRSVAIPADALPPVASSAQWIPANGMGKRERTWVSQKLLIGWPGAVQRSPWVTRWNN